MESFSLLEKFENFSLIGKIAFIAISCLIPLLGIGALLYFIYCAYKSRKQMFIDLNSAGKELNSDSLISFAKNLQRSNRLILIITIQQTLITAFIIFMLLN